MADGTQKPIEQVKEGDFVLSKNEKTGEVASKKVLHTSIKPAIWTRKITFSDGNVVETTDEHPLYFEGKGLLPAKEAGIGTSTGLSIWSRPQIDAHLCLYLRQDEAVFSFILTDLCKDQELIPPSRRVCS